MTKNGKVLVSIGIGLIIVIIIAYLLIKKGSNNPTSVGGSNPLFANSVLSSNPFQTLLTGKSSSIWQNLFNANVTSGGYNITLPSYISGPSIKGSTPAINTNYNPQTLAVHPQSPTLDLQYLPKGCSIDNYLLGNC